MTGHGEGRGGMQLYLWRVRTYWVMHYSLPIPPRTATAAAVAAGARCDGQQVQATARKGTSKRGSRPTCPVRAHHVQSCRPEGAHAIQNRKPTTTPQCK